MTENNENKDELPLYVIIIIAITLLLFLYVMLKLNLSMHQINTPINVDTRQEIVINSTHEIVHTE